MSGEFCRAGQSVPELLGWGAGQDPGCLGTMDQLEGAERGLPQLLTGHEGGYACSAIRSYSNPILECLLGIRHFVGS